MAMQFVISKFMGGGKSATVTTTDASGNAVSVAANTGDIPPFSARPDTLAEGAVYNPIPQRIAPIWENDAVVDLTIVISPTFVHEPLARVPKDRVVAQESAFKIGNHEDKREVNREFTVPKEVQNNGTLWGHFYVGLTGSKLDPSTPGYDPTKAYHFVRPLTQYLGKKKVKKTKNLLAASQDVEEIEEEDTVPGQIIKSFYHPNFTMSFIPDTGVMAYPNMHPAARQFTHLDATGSRDASGQNGWYYPVLFINTFWQLRAHMTELNDTVTTLPIHIDLNNQANWLYSIIASIDEGQKQTQRQIAQGGPGPAGGGDGSEFEMIKGVLLDTNIYLLGTTIVVSVLHMIFEMLAFKSDIVSCDIQNLLLVLTADSLIGEIRRIMLASQCALSSPMSLCKL
jgi:hypothetical protein